LIIIIVPREVVLSSITAAAETISNVLLGDLTRAVFRVILSPLWNNGEALSYATYIGCAVYDENIFISPWRIVSI
jgi:hypothetical protein